MSLKIEAKSLKRLQRTLNQMNRQGVKFAEVFTLNDLAFSARKEGGAEIGRQFTERNKFTRGSLGVRRANTSNMVAEMGTRQQYLADQQEGFTRDNVSIATTFAAGQTGSNRTRPVIKSRRRPAVKLAKGGRKGKNRAQTNIIRIAEAKKAGKKFAMLSFPGARGIFLLRKRSLRMVYDMRKKSTTTPKTPWLENTRAATGTKANKFFARNMVKQLKRVGFR